MTIKKIDGKYITPRGRLYILEDNHFVSTDPDGKHRIHIDECYIVDIDAFRESDKDDFGSVKNTGGIADELK